MSSSCHEPSKPAVVNDCCGSATPVKAPSSCCAEPAASSSSLSQGQADCCGPSEKKSFDWLLWGSLIAVVILYAANFTSVSQGDNWLSVLMASVFDLMNTMWWGLMLGIVMVSLIGQVPREFVMSVLGTRTGVKGILRATAAGVLLDLCSHGILMVGAKLYERGASAGQMMAFLIASPWNSFSLTLILIAFIGLPWTLVFIVVSAVIAIITGLVFERLTDKGVLPSNPHQTDLPPDFRFWPAAVEGLKRTQFTAAWFGQTFVDGLQGSRMVLRWLLFGVLLASLVRTFVSPEHFAHFFGPTLVGLLLTMVASTVIEVCSEGSTPIAADLFTRAGAPGNSFAFLMTGVSTDYTEIMVVKDTTRSWNIALFLPLLTLPQVLVMAWVMNGATF